MLSSAIIAGTVLINTKNEDEGMHYVQCDSALNERGSLRKAARAKRKRIRLHLSSLSTYLKFPDSV